MYQNEEFPTVEDTRGVRDEFDLCTEDIISTTLPVNARTCYEIFCDVSRVPEWVSNVSSVQILAFDDQRRPVRAAFLSSIGRVSAGYTLDYDYDDEAMVVSWATPSGTMTQMRGRAAFIELSERATMLHYQLRADLPTSMGLSGGSGGHAASIALNDFRDYVTRAFILC